MKEIARQEEEFLQLIALSGMKPLAGERTLQALYHILRGRKANQTSQDVHLFRLYPYYRLFPQLSKEDWEEIVAALLDKNLIQPKQMDVPKTSFVVTQKGEEVLREGMARCRLAVWFEPFHRLPEAGGWIPPFWLRLHLMVQTVSQLLAQAPSFYPLVQDRQVQSWVKQQLAEKNERQRWMSELHGELYSLLAPLPAEVQPLIVRQFAGAGQTGLTIRQLAVIRRQPPSLILIQWRYGLALMIERLLGEEKSRFPLLSRLIAVEKGSSLSVSRSALETYKLLKRRLGLDEIARIRGITRNTVEDHLVEIALHCPEWDASPFLQPADRMRILAVSDELQTHRLRKIKDRLGEEYSYLQIRLALAQRERSETQ
ncbi:hypothetical protein G3578_05395 [Brevibacillus sp. SYP-B805]|uniref:helix-turn-helix domain-containing protein n=1 Tax=Brevibacillus sp. SYP-B805 TaxID=1578199 RepID=UPI0013EA087D|nr:helix-turn-helix domain-containing protein [Brevibacillus sp. SYP-B805]NGQ94614.1 hypothetical protein [Brevibacillus sp. SYP-B805]